MTNLELHCDNHVPLCLFLVVSVIVYVLLLHSITNNSFLGGNEEKANTTEMFIKSNRPHVFGPFYESHTNTGQATNWLFSTAKNQFYNSECEHFATVPKQPVTLPVKTVVLVIGVEPAARP